jgi:hypothetical protein
MESIEIMERHERHPCLKTAAHQVASAAKPPTSVEQDVNQHLKLARQLAISQLTELAARTGRLANARPLGIAAHQVVSVARPPTSVEQDAKRHLGRVAAALESSRRMERVGPKIARRVSGRGLETAVLARASVEALQTFAVKDGQSNLFPFLIFPSILQNQIDRHLKY